MAFRFEKLTVKGQEALQRAQEIAEQNGHQQLLPLHLLKALLDEEQGIVRPLIQKIGANVGQLETMVASELSRLPKVSGTNVQPGAAPATIKVLEKAQQLADQMKDAFISTEHLLLALVQTGDQAQRLLGIPFKRARPRPIAYLEYEEIAAILAGVDRSTRAGRRDYTLLAAMFNTGARVQEILDVRANDLQLTKPYQLRLMGKGRKVRWCPLWAQTAQLLRAWCAECSLDLRAAVPVFVNQRGRPLSRFGVRFILAKHIRQAAQQQPGLSRKKLHPHSLRHSTAVHLLKSGVDLPTIAHWLGHASVNTTNRYVTVDLELKRKALARAQPIVPSRSAPAPWRRDPGVLEWLEAL